MGKNRVLKLVIENLNDKKIWISILLVFKTISVGLGILVPYMVGELIDNMEDICTTNILALGVLTLLSLLIESIVTYCFAIFGQSSAIHVRSLLWSRVLRLKSSYYDKTHSGEISSRMINDTSCLSDFLSDSLPDLYTSLLTLVMMLLILFSLDTWLGGIFCILFPMMIIVMVPASGKMKNIAFQQQGIYARLNELFTETIEQIKFVKAYNAEENEEKRLALRMREWYLNAKKYHLIQAVLSPVMAGVTSLSLFLVCGIGAYRVKMGYITMGTIIIFALYMISAIEPVEIMGNFLMEYRELQGALDMVESILNEDMESTDGKSVDENADCLTFRDVQFGYAEEIILHDVSFSAKKNECIALVGESGGGKTTIFSLIERFYDVTSGEILWGNNTIKSFELYEWRKHIGYVFQDKILVSGTIRENMTYGINRSISDTELEDAARRANIYNFIMKQERKFDTYVGEKGDLLSGGQQQRIAIARMFLRNPKIILLDEVTANLDAESEYQIINSLKELYEGRITLIIAHKLKTVMEADKILVLENGHIVGTGKHEELMKTNLYYKNIIQYEMR